MKEMRPQKQLLQFVMLALLSVFSVLVTSGESFAAINCYNCHGNNTNDALPLDTPVGSPASYRNITTGAVKGNHQTHLNGLNITQANQANCARCHNNSNYSTGHRSGTITLNRANNGSPLQTNYVGGNMTVSGDTLFLFKNQTSVPTLGTCSNVNCHFEAPTPQWGSDPAAMTCNSCHSSSPSTGSHTRHTLDASHAPYTCNSCHAARPNFQHATSAGNAGRKIDTTGVLGSSGGVGVYSGAATNYLPSQTRVFGSCTVTYCHSSGQAFNGTTAIPYTTATATWNNPASGSCGTCHVTAGLNTGRHSKHLLADNNCGNCHTGATLATMNSATHVDGLIDVAAGVGYNQGNSSARGNGYGRCSNAACHSVSTAAPLLTPSWGVSATCASCHTAAPVTGAHTTHIAFPGVTCETCHTGAGTGTTTGGAGHFNNLIDVAQYAGPIAKHAPNVYTATCSTACHSTSTAPVSTPSWGQLSTCSMCHQTSPTTGAHTSHLNAPVSASCGSCHTGATIGTSGGPGHGNTLIDVALYSPNQIAKHAPGVYTATCSTQCHNTYGATAVVTPTWGVLSNCNSCHVASPTTGAHTTHLTAVIGASCASCHTGATAGVTGGNSHGDGNIDVAVGYTNNNAAKHAAGGPYTGTCSTQCHNAYSNVTPVTTTSWGVISTCATCHAASPVTGAHTTHLTALIGANCGTCHTGATAGTTGGNGHGDGNVDVAVGYAASVTKHAAGTYVSTCSTQCHNAYSNVTPVTTTSWGVISTCATCHAASPTTGAHTTHLSAIVGANCGTCHTGATAGVTGGNGHGDGNVDVALGYAASVTKHAAGTYTPTCSTACHNAAGTTAVLTPSWGVLTNCGSCHAASPTTGDHTKHLTAPLMAIACSNCHTGATAGVTGGNGHGDGNIDVFGYATPNKPKGTAATTCSTLCHSTSLTAVATPVWGTAANCSSCHAITPVTGAHTKHVLHTFVACGSCHNGAVLNSNAGTAHMDGNIDVTQGYAPNVAKHAVGTYTNTCSVSCHNGPATNPFTAPAVTWGAVLNCAGCHGYPPVNTNHTGVLAGSCNSCHDNVNSGGTLTNSTFVNVQEHLDGVVQGGKCNSCHGFPPVQSMTGLGTNANYSTAKLQNYSGGGGVHSIAAHLALTVKESLYADKAAKFGACVTCHPNTDALGTHNNVGGGSFFTANVQVVVDPQFKFDKNRPIVYNAKQSGTNKTSGTCANVACHFQKSPLWSSQSYTQGH